jgi:integrase/recombinase XerD
MQRLHPIECFETARSRRALRVRGHPYHYVLGPCLALGFYRYAKRPCKWFARYRGLNGKYVTKDLGLVEEEFPSHDLPTLSFENARAAAQAWFDTPEVKAVCGRGDNYMAPGGLCVCPIGDEYTVSHAIADFLDWRRKFRSPQNHYAMQSQANRYIIPLIGSIPCAQLTAADVRPVPLAVERTTKAHGRNVVRYQIDPDSLTPEERRRRRMTANHALCVLKWAMKSAFDEGRITNEVAWRPVKGFRHVEKNRVDYLTWPQAKRLVDAARPDLRRLILAGLYTGCRVSELYRITAGDLMEGRMAIYVHPGKTYRGRTIALPDEGYHFFKSLARGKAKHELLLVRRNGEPWSTSYLSEVFRPLARSLGISDSFVFHCIRHTYASLLLQAGTPPIVVARQLGHINMLTVIKTYSHVVDDFYDEELRQRFKPNFLSEPDLFENTLPGEDKLPQF